MFLESPQNWKDYSLIDSGNFEKLERFGSYVLIRPEPKALWKPSLPEKEWLNMAHTKFTAGAGFGKSGKEDTGTWKMLKKMPAKKLSRGLMLFGLLAMLCINLFSVRISSVLLMLAAAVVSLAVYFAKGGRRV